jgi:hypothetical protein
MLKFWPLLVLLASPLSAQTLDWTWDATSLPIIGDPATLIYELSIDEGDWQPLTGVTCAPVLPDLGVAMDCWAAVTVTEGAHLYLIRASRAGVEGLPGMPTQIVAPSRLTVQGSTSEPQPCPYTPPNGAPGTRQIGAEIKGAIPYPAGPRVARLLTDGWVYLVPAREDATALRVWLVCVGSRN